MRTLLFLSLAFSLLIANAQPGPGPGAANRQERIQALRVAYFTEQLSLTPDEAKGFWPVFDAYSDEMDQVRKQTRMMKRDVRQNYYEMDEKELEAVADEYITLKKREYEITAKYHPQFKNALPAAKVVMFYKAEQEFPRWVLKNLREMRE